MQISQNDEPNFDLTAASDPSLAPGEARCPGPSTRDIICSDADNAPDVLLEQNYEFMGDEDIPFDRYTSAQRHEQEITNMWSATWQWACRVEHIPNPGDYYVYDVGPYSAIVLRDEQNEIHAFVNSCPHRGMQFCESGTTGRGKQFLRCPFHGMSWHLDGSLREIPCRWDFPHIQDDNFRLIEIPSDSWAGFVFVNFDRDAGPLDQYMGVLPDHFAHWPLADRYVDIHMEKILPGNWKMCLEAFLEAFHVLATHPEGLHTAGDANAQYDVFGENVSRFIHTVGYPSPHLSQKLSQPQSQADLFAALGHDPADLPADKGARQHHADLQRAAKGAELDVDLSTVSNSEMLDSIEYYLFPNACFFPGIGIPLIYRFRPIDADHCLHDILMLKPCPANGEPPPPAEVIKLGLNDSYTTVPAFAATGLAHVLDQDTENFKRQRAGMKAAVKVGQTLGNYQEVRIRHLHNTLNTYLERR